MTFTPILLQKTISEWRKVLDINRYNQRPYVVVDPLDQDGLLYLTHREYERLVQTAMSSSSEVQVVARPGMEQTLSDLQSQESNSQSSINFTNTKKESSSPPHEPEAKYGSIFKRLQRLLRTRVNSSTISLDDGNISELVRQWGNILAFWAGIKVSAVSVSRNLDSIGSHLSRVCRYHGPLYCIKYIKATLFCIYNYVGSGPVLTDTRALGATVALTHNLPRWLPLDVRLGIRNGNLRYIRAYTSLLNMFKGLAAPYPDPSYATIMGAPGEDSFTELEDSVWRFWAFVTNGNIMSFHQYFFGGQGIRVSTSAGPNGGPAWSTLPLDLFAWLQSGKTTPLLLMKELGMSHLFGSLKRVWRVLSKVENIKYYFPSIPAELIQHGRISLRDLRRYLTTQKAFSLGKLALKFEPAGKVRVFALVDTLTQSICRPIHLWMFQVLKKLSSDATFDQERNLNSLTSLEPVAVFSYDLTAATDNIPLTLYRRVFAPIFGERITTLWLQLLVDRDFNLPKGDKSPFSSVRYTRGQPMGALSSWASLALVHHFIIFLASEQAGISFTELPRFYRVLGDDIAITHTELAKFYHEFCQRLGIPLNVKKSLISDDGLTNFANRVIWNNLDISPVSLKEELSVESYSSRLEMALRLYRRGWSPRGECISLKVSQRSVFDILRLVHTPDQFRGLMHIVNEHGYLPTSIRRVLYSVLNPDWSKYLADHGSSLPFLYSLAQVQTRVGGILAELGQEVPTTLTTKQSLQMLYVIAHLRRALREQYFLESTPPKGWLPPESVSNPWDANAEFPLTGLGQAIVADERAARFLQSQECLDSEQFENIHFSKQFIDEAFDLKDALLYEPLYLEEEKLSDKKKDQIARLTRILLVESAALAVYLEGPPVFESRTTLKSMSVVRKRQEQRDARIMRAFLHLKPMTTTNDLLRWLDEFALVFRQEESREDPYFFSTVWLSPFSFLNKPL